MSDVAKVTLSTGELAMAMDQTVILTKQAVIDKSFALFSSIVPAINEKFEKINVDDLTVSNAHPKISKGENYKGFPYVIMDYPSVFEKNNIFAVRTMFWWGHHISITLHLSGRHKLEYEKNLFEKLSADNNFYIANGDDEWQHDFSEDNFVPIAEISAEIQSRILERNFLKIALKYELHHWNMMQLLLPQGYDKIVNLLKR